MSEEKFEAVPQNKDSAGEETVTLDRESMLTLQLLNEQNNRRIAERTSAGLMAEKAEEELKKFATELNARLTQGGAYEVVGIDTATGVVKLRRVENKKPKDAKINRARRR